MTWKKEAPWVIAQDYMRTDGRPAFRPAIRRFCRWMSENHLCLEDLTQDHIERFWTDQRKGKLRPCTIDCYKIWLHKWLYWLALRGLISLQVETPIKRHLFEPLAACAKRFLTSFPGEERERRIRYFHTWLRREKLALQRLRPHHIEAFASRPRGVEVSLAARSALLKDLEPYFFWLHDQRLMTFRVERRAPKLERLPRDALSFIEALRTTRKPNTCDAYETSIRRFHIWLDEAGVALGDVKRRDMVRWLSFLVENGISKGSRRNRINHLRGYFEWLFDNDLLPFDPTGLLYSTDVPRLPNYLPRPFPIHADIEIRRRLAENPSFASQALLLMRLTGLRIGELIRLEPSCVWKGRDDHAFLKVPLGKLDNERLVPLDERGLAIIRKLRESCLPSDPFLLAPTRARSTLNSDLADALKAAAVGIDTDGPVVSHRLRHTYATELLNAGVSLSAIMKLLGHRSIAMTACYAALTPKTVLDEYNTAMATISVKYQIASNAKPLPQADPQRLLLDAICALRSLSHDMQLNDRSLGALIKRLNRIHQDIASLQNRLR